jgi:hypothetical protein
MYAQLLKANVIHTCSVMPVQLGEGLSARLRTYRLVHNDARGDVFNSVFLVNFMFFFLDTCNVGKVTGVGPRNCVTPCMTYVLTDFETTNT